MKWIGFNRTDNQQEKFEFDDELILDSNPPKYEVTFEDGRKEYVETQNIFKLKPSKPFRREKPVINETKVIPVEQPSTNFDDDVQRMIEEELKPKRRTVEKEPETIVVVEEKPKKKTTTRKKKEVLTITEDVARNTDIQYQSVDVHKYEYKTIFDDFDNIDTINDQLNKLGEEGWEMINFKIVQQMFSKLKLFCILKRNKMN